MHVHTRVKTPTSGPTVELVQPVGATIGHSQFRQLFEECRAWEHPCAEALQRCVLSRLTRERDERAHTDFAAAHEDAMSRATEARMPLHRFEEFVRRGEEQQAKLLGRKLGLNGEASRPRPPTAVGSEGSDAVAFDWHTPGERGER